MSWYFGPNTWVCLVGFPTLSGDLMPLFLSLRSSEGLGHMVHFLGLEVYQTLCMGSDSHNTTQIDITYVCVCVCCVVLVCLKLTSGIRCLFICVYVCVCESGPYHRGQLGPAALSWWSEPHTCWTVTLRQTVGGKQERRKKLIVWQREWKCL